MSEEPRWTRLYTAVLIVLAVSIAAMYAFAKFFS
jgi:hypothetical protein